MLPVDLDIFSSSSLSIPLCAQICAKGRPAPGVVVTLSHPTTRLIRVALTDLRGEYEIRGLEPGVEYIVRLTHPNHRNERLETRAYAAVHEPTRVQLKPRRTAMVRQSERR